MNGIESCCIIDDDEFFNLNSQKLLKEINFCQNILYFTEGQEALDGLVGLIVENVQLPTVLFLDINMPKRNGWSFLEEFEQLPKEKINHVRIYIISSFINEKLIEKSKKFNLVQDYLEKPLTEEALQNILKDLS